MLTSATVNPFAKRESHGRGSIATYRILTLLSWLLSAVITVYYALEPPHDGRYHGRSIWRQNYHYYSGFTLNSIITSIYWCVLLPRTIQQNPGSSPFPAPAGSASSSSSFSTRRTSSPLTPRP